MRHQRTKCPNEKQKREQHTQDAQLKRKGFFENYYYHYNYSYDQYFSGDYLKGHPQVLRILVFFYFSGANQFLKS